MHSLLEIISIVIAALIFFITYSTQECGRSIQVVLLGCFFLAARLSAGLGLLVYAIRPHTHSVTVKARFAMMAGTLAVVVLVAWVILFHESRLPAMYIDGEGLTSLKITVEWGVFCLYLLTAALIYRRRYDIVTFDARSLILGLLIMATGELFLIEYVQVASTANLLGHVYKVIGYSFLYHAIFAEAIRQPFLRIKQLMNAVEQERDFAKQLLDTAPEQSRIRALFQQSKHVPTHGHVETIVTRSDDKCEIEWNAEALHDADNNITGLLAIGLDVSERIRAMESLRHSERELKRLNESLEDRVDARTAELVRRSGAMKSSSAPRLTAFSRQIVPVAFARLIRHSAPCWATAKLNCCR
ncbi:MAG: MASE3 domain-containing protein [Gammaproteobacteria bacterium]|nr:MASE3 domain-containing protein [Gammaproteobacteria bacterium]